MTRTMTAHRRLATGALVLGPVALAAGELLRLRVEGGVPENEADPAAEAGAQLTAIAAEPGAWLAHGLLTLVAALCLVVAVGAIVIRSRARCPLLSAVAGVTGLLFALALAMHVGFYSATVQVLAGQADELRPAAVEIWASDSGSLMLAGVSVFMLTSLLAPILLSALVWRARLAPWWATVLGFGGLLVFEFLGATNPATASLPLLLLVPFGFVARYDDEPAATGVLDTVA